MSTGTLINEVKIERPMTAASRNALDVLEELVRAGYTSEDIYALLLRQWHQEGGRGRGEFPYYLEMLRVIVAMQKEA